MPKIGLLLQTVASVVAIFIYSSTRPSSSLLSRALVFVSVLGGLFMFGKIVAFAKDRDGLNRAFGDGTNSIPPEFRLSSARSSSKSNSTRICVISDTHNREIQLPDADILIHCGDFSMRGTEEELELFFQWMERQPHKHKVLVPGNHDYAMITSQVKMRARIAQFALLLENSGARVAGLSLYGAPQSLSHRKKMAFQEDSDEKLEVFWKEIPENLDVLITHGPPFGFGDFNSLTGKRMGCPLLMKHLESLTNPPRYHFFGHIHQGYGIYPGPRTVFGNAAICNSLYQPVHPPLLFDVEPRD